MVLGHEAAQNPQRVRIEHVVVIDGDDIGAARTLEKEATAPDDVQVVLDAPEANAGIARRQISTDLLRVRSMRPVVEQNPFEIVVALARGSSQPGRRGTRVRRRKSPS